MGSRILKAHTRSTTVADRTLCGLKLDGKKQVPLHPTPDGHAPCVICARIRKDDSERQAPKTFGVAVDGPAINQGTDGPSWQDTAE